MDRLSTKGQMIDQIDLRGVPHSGFDRSNHNYGTGKLGVIIPTRLDEVYPGDRIKGRPQDVTNFEPLAAPLMGSMVLKQEAFFVPYIQLWRHAYKFFTGKNGFDENMPTISPFAIWQTFLNSFHYGNWCNVEDLPDAPGREGSMGWLCYRLQAYYESGTSSYENVNNSTFREDVESFYSLMESDINTLYGPRKMVDLVTPCLASIKDFIDHGLYNYTLPSQSQDSKLMDIKQLCVILGNICNDIFDFFHGVSSIFDYLGWPVALKENFDSSQINRGLYEDGLTTIFHIAFYDNIVGNHAITLRDFLGNLFSKVPLVFNPFKAYYLIWYWNYRDQLLETDILDPDEDEFLGSTITDNVILYCCILRHRCWFKDTFTTALTNTGNGNMLVPVTTIGGNLEYTYYDDGGQLVNTTDPVSAINSGATLCHISSEGIDYEIPMNYLKGSFVSSYDSSETLENASISLDLFDRIKRLREYVQKRLILGYEVDDVVYSSFMVRMSNVRIHIPEILGQGRDAVQINTIVNNTSTSEQIAGDRTATAFVHGSMSEMNYFSEEWGLYLQFKTIMPIQSYAGGMQRLYLKTHPLDYMWPEFATMGMDAVYNCELAALGTRLTDEQGLQVFGYQGRYYDLKSRMDEEHGRLLTDLNYLTFSREWDKNNPPKLNYMFVHCHPRLDGFVVDSPLEDVFRYDCYNAQAWERRLPVPSEIVG